MFDAGQEVTVTERRWRMYVDVHGPVDGTPILFLHGSMVASWMWLGQVEGLAEYQCFLLDLPGMGRSGDEQWVSFGDTADRVADVIVERCDGGTTHVVGLSLGGIIGLNLASRHPRLVRSLLVSGVPMGTVPAYLRVLNSLMPFLYVRPWGARLIGRLFGMPDDESMTAFVETAAQTDKGALRRIVDEVSRAPLPNDLAGINTPTLVVVGTKDTKPALLAAPFLQQEVPSVRSFLVPDMGHQWNAQNPELFNAMVRTWIEDQTPELRLVPVTQ